jgi:hypothetical protein
LPQFRIESGSIAAISYQRSTDRPIDRSTPAHDIPFHIANEPTHPKLKSQFAFDYGLKLSLSHASGEIIPNLRVTDDNESESVYSESAFDETFGDVTTSIAVGKVWIAMQTTNSRKTRSF